MKKYSSYLIGEKNKLYILTLIHLYGWLTLQQIAHTVWKDSKHPHVMAGRVLRRLVNDKMIKPYRVNNRMLAYVLREAGVKLLRSETNFDKIKPGYNLLQNGQTFLNHRNASNSFVLEKYNNDNSVSLALSEQELFRRCLEEYRDDPWHKMPDGLILRAYKANDDSIVRSAEWLEMEMSRRSAKNRKEFVEFIVRTLSHTCDSEGKVKLPGIADLWHISFSIVSPKAKVKNIQPLIVKELFDQMPDDMPNHLLGRINFSAIDYENFKYGGVVDTINFETIKNKPSSTSEEEIEGYFGKSLDKIIS